jgi:phosphoglycolate phosphatase-like HAD superfamily hydrolase
MPSLLCDLARAGRAVAVVTNKPTAFAASLVQALGLGGWIAAVVGPEDAPARKPSAEHVVAAARRLGRAPSEAVVVGDGTTDILAGRAAGAVTVAVLWGYRGREELVGAQPDHVVETVHDLRALLLGATP